MYLVECKTCKNKYNSWEYLEEYPWPRDYRTCSEKCFYENLDFINLTKEIKEKFNVSQIEYLKNLILKHEDFYLEKIFETISGNNLNDNVYKTNK